MRKRIILGGAGLLMAMAVGLEFSVTPAYANKVDCAKVMAEVNAGKKAGAIAKELSISTSSVYRCKSKAKAHAGAGAAASSPGAKASAAAGK